jgi:hypothetical protein
MPAMHNRHGGSTRVGEGWLLAEGAVVDVRVVANDTVYQAARLIHPLTTDLKGDQRAKNHTAQSTQYDALKEEPVP